MNLWRSLRPEIYLPLRYCSASYLRLRLPTPGAPANDSAAKMNASLIVIMTSRPEESQARRGYQGREILVRYI